MTFFTIRKKKNDNYSTLLFDILSRKILAPNDKENLGGVECVRNKFSS